jgi:MoxR-like ATPase
MNPDYRGTRPLNQAFADRFAIRLNFPYDKQIEAKLLKNKALQTMAEQLRAEHDRKAIATPVSTRALVAFIQNAKQFGMDFATYSYVNSLYL